MLSHFRKNSDSSYDGCLVRRCLRRAPGWLEWNVVFVFVQNMRKWVISGTLCLHNRIGTTSVYSDVACASLRSFASGAKANPDESLTLKHQTTSSINASRSFHIDGRPWRQSTMPSLWPIKSKPNVDHLTLCRHNHSMWQTAAPNAQTSLLFNFANYPIQPGLLFFFL